MLLGVTHFGSTNIAHAQFEIAGYIVIMGVMMAAEYASVSLMQMSVPTPVVQTSVSRLPPSAPDFPSVSPDNGAIQLIADQNSYQNILNAFQQAQGNEACIADIESAITDTNTRDPNYWMLHPFTATIGVSANPNGNINFVYRSYTFQFVTSYTISASDFYPPGDFTTSTWYIDLNNDGTPDLTINAPTQSITLSVAQVVDWTIVLNSLSDCTGGPGGLNGNQPSSGQASPSFAQGSYITPTSIAAGGTITAYYSVTNPTSSPIQVGLGMSIQPSGSGNPVSDPSNDVVVTVYPGTNTYSRSFNVPSYAAPGSYDWVLAIWSGAPGSSNQYDSTGWQTGGLTVTSS